MARRAAALTILQGLSLGQKQNSARSSVIQSGASVGVNLIIGFTEGEKASGSFHLSIFKSENAS